jgi:hypothetical protein
MHPNFRDKTESLMLYTYVSPHLEGLRRFDLSGVEYLGDYENVDFSDL